MKSLFKSLLFTAVAAFAACNNDNDEIRITERIVDFTATIGHELRSGFVEREQSTAYKSKWDGGEILILSVGSTTMYPTIDADGRFFVTLHGDEQYVDIYSPKASWEYNTSNRTYLPVIPEVQTPRAHSVDPAAHIIEAQNIKIANSERVSFSFEHAVAYGKMTVNTPADFEIAKVVINLKGDKDLTYTINATNVKDNTFWFASDAIVVSEMTVRVYNANDEVLTKSVTIADGALQFNYGRVSTFSVSNLTGESPVFTKVTYSGSYTDKRLTFVSDILGELKVNFYPDTTNGGAYIGEGHYYNPEHLYVGNIDFSYYCPVGGTKTEIKDITIDVSIVDNKYKFIFHVEAGEHKFDSSYHGLIEGLNLP